MIELRRKNFQ